MFVGAAEEREETPTEDVADGEESEDAVVENEEAPTPTEGASTPPPKEGAAAKTEKVILRLLSGQFWVFLAKRIPTRL